MADKRSIWDIDEQERWQPWSSKSGHALRRSIPTARWWANSRSSRSRWWKRSTRF